jgi:hypothetical protein
MQYHHRPYRGRSQTKCNKELKLTCKPPQEEKAKNRKLVKWAKSIFQHSILQIKKVS